MKSKPPLIGIVVVAYGNPHEVKKLLTKLKKQTLPGDRVVLVDNHQDHLSAKTAEQHSLANVVVKSENVGFSGGCNKGVAAIEGLVDIYFFINPDTMPANNLLASLREVELDEHNAWMPLLLLPTGMVNSAGNVVHMSGLSWCDGYDQLPADYQDPKKISVLSGASMAITATWWHKVGGLEDKYFMYYEDTDLSTRLLLAGATISLIPTSSVTHFYDFQKGGHKWFYIERNRPLYIIRTWPMAVIIVLAPLLVLVELALWPVAILQRRLWLKLRAAGSALKALPWAIQSRRKIQKARTISSADFFRTLATDLNTPLLGRLSQNKVLVRLLGWYGNLAVLLLDLIKS